MPVKEGKVSALFNQRPLQVRMCVSTSNYERESNRFQSPLQFTQFVVHCGAPQGDKQFQLSQHSDVWSQRSQKKLHAGSRRSCRVQGIKPLTFWLQAHSSDQDVIMHKFPLRLHLRVTFPSESLQVPWPSSNYCRSSHHPLLRSLADVWHIIKFSSNFSCQ